jgi:hypothetical protein
VISIPNVSFIERDARPLQPRTNLFLKREFSPMIGLADDVQVSTTFQRCEFAYSPGLPPLSSVDW